MKKQNILLAVFTTAFVFVAVVMMGMQTFAKAGNDSKVKLSDIKKTEGLTEVTKNIYVSTGNYMKVNMVLVTSNGKGALIDFGAEPAEGQRIKDFADKNGISIETFIVTHLHGDHLANQAMFNAPDDKVYIPATTKDGQIIKIEDETFRIIKTPGHANNDHISVELENEHILIAGDVIVTNWVPVMFYGGSYHELKTTLEAIKKQNYDVIIPGHGDIIDSSTAVDNQLQYITSVYSKIEKISDAVKRPVKLDALKDKLYKGIKLEDCIKDMSVIDKDTSETLHQQNIDIILGTVALDRFISKPEASVRK